MRLPPEVTHGPAVGRGGMGGGDGFCERQFEGSEGGPQPSPTVNRVRLAIGEGGGGCVRKCVSMLGGQPHFEGPPPLTSPPLSGTLYFGWRAMAVKVDAKIKEMFDPNQYTQRPRLCFSPAHWPLGADSKQDLGVRIKRAWKENPGG